MFSFKLLAGRSQLGCLLCRSVLLDLVVASLPALTFAANVSVPSVPQQILSDPEKRRAYDLQQLRAKCAAGDSTRSCSCRRACSRA